MKPTHGSGSLKPSKILLVHNDDGTSSLLASVLEEAGFFVDSLADGHQAWETLLNEHYDLVVTKDNLAGLTGLDLIRRMRESGMAVPVIFISDSLFLGNPQDYPELQIAAMLLEPIVLPDLLAAARRVLRSGATDRQVGGAPPFESQASGTRAANLTPEPSRASEGLEAGGRARARHRILIADDDALVRSSLAAVLETEGFVVDEAGTGIEAVTSVIEASPDLVLLDLNMPHWDGWTAFSQIDRTEPALPVIVITARPNQYDKAARLGVAAFMEKPLNIPILMGAIKRLTSDDERRLRRHRAGPGPGTRLLNDIDSTFGLAG